MKAVISTVKSRDEDELVKALSEDLPVGVCIMQKGNFCYVNSTFPMAIGYTVDELVGKDSLEIVVPEDREIVKANTMKMLEGELRAPYQFRVTCKDGSIAWVMATVKSIQYHGKRAILGNYMEITERKQIEEALRKNEERYRELADSITDVFFAMDEHLRYTYWNKASEVLTGIRATDALGKSLHEVFANTPGTKTVEKAYREVLRTRQPRTFVNDFDIDGRHYVLEISAYPAKDGISVFVRDITEHRQAEEARREAEEEKSVLLEEAPVSIIHTDLQGRITYVNKRFELESGYSREAIIGKEGLKLGWFSPDTTQYFADRMAARLKGSPVRHWEAQFKCMDGQSIWIDLEGKILTRSGVPVGFQIIATNITERRQAEEALRQSEERYRTMLEEMEEGYYEVDIAGNFTFVNDAMSRILGYSRDELIGVNYKTYTPKEDINPIFEAYNRVYRTGEPLKWFPIPEIRKDGTRILAEDSVFPLRNEKGEVVGFRGISRNITERKRAEEALRQSEERYRTILEETGDGYFETDLAGNFTFVNDVQTRLLGYTGKELIGTNFRAFTPEESTKAVLEAYGRMYETGVPLKSFIDEVIRKDGSHGFAETSAFPIRDDRGKIVGFRGVRRDITGRKQMEEAIRQSEEKYRTILEEMEDAYFEVDLGGHLTFVNNSVCRDLGYSGEELMGKSYRAFTAEEDTESLFRVFNQVYQTRVPNKGFPWKTVRKDGTRGFAETSISLLKNDKGEIIGFRGVGRDITERRKAEEALKVAAEEWSKTFDSISDAVSIHDRDFQIRRANKAFADLFGKSLHEIIGVHCYELHKGNEPRHGCPHQYTLTSGKPAAAEFYESHSGRYVLESTSPILNERGETIGAVHITRDVTEQKRQNERLVMADRLASIGELAAGAAHELNNPLASIIGLSELLMEKNTPAYIRNDLAMIRDEARRAANVTNNLLTFARRYRPARRATQIQTIIEDVLKLRGYAHRSNSIEVKRYFAVDLPEIRVDPFQMQQVFLNIVINAEYFMTQAHNKGTLTVTTKRQEGSVVVSFADDGPGIPQENLGRIFDPFFTTKEAGKGTGLGLSICHGIVTAHGGQIYARSQPGEGASIFVELPINGCNDAEARL